jgi:hypothetical protein
VAARAKSSREDHREGTKENPVYPVILSRHLKTEPTGFRRTLRGEAATEEKLSISLLGPYRFSSSHALTL